MKFPVVLSFIALLFSVALEAQTGTAKPAASTVSAVVCRTLKDSASYALGYNIGESLVQRYGAMDPNIIAAAIKDVYAKKKGVVDKNVGSSVVQNFLTKETQKKSAANKAIGAKFLAANAKKPGIIMTASGLQYQVITMGTGDKPTNADKVRVNYAGTLINGFEFDSSNRHGGPAEFPIGGVIAGWTEALQLMPVGSKFKLFIPSNLAYGDNDMGADIPAGSTLIFEVELLAIVK